MTLYHKKPVEAMQFTLDTKDQVINWVTCNRYPDWELDNPILVIQTPEGNMITHIGDWVIKGINGEFYPCKPDIFFIIREMLPLWMAAMYFAEHGRAADLDRIRNYYNGRDNPLTEDEIHYMFSV